MATVVDGGALAWRALEAAAGARYVFGVVGITATSLASAAGGRRFLAFRNEQSAGAAAAAYGFLTGTPGLLLTVSSGSGSVHGLSHANANAWPFLMVSGSCDAAIGGYAKLAVKATTIADIPRLVFQTCGAAVSGRPGGCYLEILSDVLQQTLPESQADALLDAEIQRHGRSTRVEILTSLNEQSAALAASAYGYLLHTVPGPVLLHAAEILGSAIITLLNVLGNQQIMDPLGRVAANYLRDALCRALKIIMGLSQAHLDPAVTITMVMQGRITPLQAFIQIVDQCLGFTMAFLLAAWISPPVLAPSVPVGFIPAFLQESIHRTLLLHQLGPSLHQADVANMSITHDIAAYITTILNAQAGRRAWLNLPLRLIDAIINGNYNGMFTIVVEFLGRVAGMMATGYYIG